MKGERHEDHREARHYDHQTHHHLQRLAAGRLRGAHRFPEARIIVGRESEYQQRVGGAFRAWGGHMSGFNLVLQPGRRIVQAWRANDWWDDHYSIVTVDLRKLNGGAE